MQLEQNLRELWATFIALFRMAGISDYVDIALVAYLIYRGMKLLRDTVAFRLAKGIFVLAGCMLAFIFQTDYSYFGILLIAVMYILRDNRLQQMFWAALLIFSQGGMEIYAVFALLLCYFYQQDKKERRLPRYFLYTFYPLHLFVFWILYCAI